MKNFAEYKHYIDKNLDRLRGKSEVMMYCTGGIRCEKASAYLKMNGVDQVRQLSGGIHRYMEAFPGKVRNPIGGV